MDHGAGPVVEVGRRGKAGQVGPSQAAVVVSLRVVDLEGRGLVDDGPWRRREQSTTMGIAGSRSDCSAPGWRGSSSEVSKPCRQQKQTKSRMVAGGGSTRRWSRERVAVYLGINIAAVGELRSDQGVRVGGSLGR